MVYATHLLLFRGWLKIGFTLAITMEMPIDFSIMFLSIDAEC